MSERSEPGTVLSERSSVKGAFVMAVWTIGSRVLGFLRDALMAATFGMSPIFGAFSMAWMVPNLLRRLFGEGAVEPVVLPALTRERAGEGKEAAHRLYRRINGWVAVGLIAVVVVAEVFLWMLLQADSLNHDPESHNRLLYLLAGMLLPYSIPICLAAISASPQQLSGRFAAPAAAPVALNIFWIGGLLFLPRDGEAGLFGFALGLSAVIFFAGLCQWMLQLPGVKKAGYPVLPVPGFGNGSGRRAARNFLPILFGAAALQINLACDQALIWALAGAEANSFAYLANRLVELPLALVAVGAAKATMPRFSGLASEKRWEELAGTLKRAVESSLLLLFAAGIGLVVLAVPIVTVLFDHGAYESKDTPLLAQTVLAYLCSLPAACLVMLFSRARQACGDVRGPAWIAVCSIPINLGLDWILLPRMGVPGAGWATTVALSVQAIWLWVGLRQFHIAVPLRAGRLVRLLLPGVVSGGAAWLVLGQMGEFASTLFGLALCVAAGVGGFILCAVGLFKSELRTLIRR